MMVIYDWVDSLAWMKVSSRLAPAQDKAFYRAQGECGDNVNASIENLTVNPVRSAIEEHLSGMIESSALEIIGACR